ncbi:hypothetical protein [Candidatus Nitrosocosmicus sp. SS]|uniref:hypothetical protein n=1 Tax=Candidatus Nitrosocosmicus agrestis TaxID=2563600 RepID=UPI00122E7F63|nr:hypothetical protein [Candidatus Nitrosocosmicus sp. SS]KAA2280241.1 hypothetical protein F1Z66_11605 [Candidatus Nitrosocosmicus sp. SS]KAF0869502.1 hypothetical protein E5N71_04540 [Candidatus Nitrosocosmicus sp. SS]
MKADTVRWTLPKEDIPITVEIEKRRYDKIVITLSEGLEFKGFLNVSSYNYISKNVAEITEIFDSEFIDYTYFGMILKTKRIPFSIYELNNVTIVAYLNGIEIDRKDVETRTFRPLLEIDQCPDEIEIQDPMKPLSLCLKLFGLGEITLKIEATLGDKSISENHSTVREVIRKLLLDTLSENPNEEDQEQELDKIEIELLLNKLENSTSFEEYIGYADFSEEHINEIKEFFKDQKKINKYFMLLKNSSNTIGAFIIAEMKIVNPSENIRLSMPVRFRGKMISESEKLHLKLSYVDSIGNEYGPLKREIRVTDKRRTKNLEFITDLAFNNIEDYSLLDVEDLTLEQPVK